jgi:hypothetical protein
MNVITFVCLLLSLAKKDFLNFRINTSISYSRNSCRNHHTYFSFNWTQVTATAKIQTVLVGLAEGKRLVEDMGVDVNLKA